MAREAFPHSLSAIVDESDIGSLTVPDKVRIIAELAGRDISYVELSEEEARARWRGQGMPVNVGGVSGFGAPRHAHGVPRKNTSLHILRVRLEHLGESVNV